MKLTTRPVWIHGLRAPRGFRWKELDDARDVYDRVFGPEHHESTQLAVKMDGYILEITEHYCDMCSEMTPEFWEEHLAPALREVEE